METQNSKPQRFLFTLKEKLIRWHPELLFWGILAVIIVRAVCITVYTLSAARAGSASMEFYLVYGLLPQYSLLSHAYACVVLALIYVLGKRNGKPHRTVFWGGLAAVILSFGYKITIYTNFFSDVTTFTLFHYVLRPALLLAFPGLFLLRMFWKRRKCYF